MVTERKPYLAYMLRMRRVWRDGRPVWQASVESPHTGERQMFAEPEALFAFLVQKMQVGAGDGRMPGAWALDQPGESGGSVEVREESEPGDATEAAPLRC